MLMVHGLWSISTPIALVEASVPDRARTPWLGRWGLAIVGGVSVRSRCGNTAIGYRQDHILASWAQFAGAAVVVVMLAALAFLIPPRRRNARLPRLNIRVAGGPIAALSFGSAALFIPKDWGWGAVAALLGLDVIMLALVIVWSRKGLGGD